MKRKLLLALCMITGSTVNLQAQQNLNIKAVDSFISYIERNGRDIGSLSICKNGKEIYHRDFGQQAIPGMTFNKDTRYQIGSITKLFTAVMIFQLIEKGKLKPDDKLAAYFPDMPGAGDITLKNMLEHSSGLGDYVFKEDDAEWLTERKLSEQEILSEIKKQGLLFKPGEKVEYSNSAYYLLARILEKAHGKNYGKILEQCITKPYQLSKIESVQANPGNVFKSYQYADGRWSEEKDFEFINALGVGDIVATTRDLNRFIELLFQHKILKKETLDQMKPGTPKEYFGRGLMLIPFHEHISYGHGGDTKGTHSAVAYNEKDSVSCSFAINGERYGHNNFAIGFLSGLYGKDYTFPEFKEVALKAEDLDKYAGVYSSPELPIKITISKDGNTLVAQGTGQPSFPLTAYDVNKFEFEQAGLKFEFKPADNSLVFRQGGMNMEMKRE